jgi:hypothetical protein
MTDELHPKLAELLKNYARDLAQVAPSPSLDARIGQLVAAAPAIAPLRRPPRRWQRPFAWAAAACFAVIAISAGILIGMRLERTREGAAVARAAPQQAALASADLAMWPSDSVALTIPAEYSPQGKLVAVNPKAKSTGKRYWIDVVVSNDGTMRIERIMPAEGKVEHQQADKNGHTLQAQ